MGKDTGLTHKHTSRLKQCSCCNLQSQPAQLLQQSLYGIWACTHDSVDPGYAYKVRRACFFYKALPFLGDGTAGLLLARAEHPQLATDTGGRSSH